MKSPLKRRGDVAVNRRLRNSAKNRIVNHHLRFLRRRYLHRRSFPLRRPRDMIDIVRASIRVLSLFPSRRHRLDGRRRIHHLQQTRDFTKLKPEEKNPLERTDNVTLLARISLKFVVVRMRKIERSGGDKIKAKSSPIRSSKCCQQSPNRYRHVMGPSRECKRDKSQAFRALSIGH